MCPDGRSRTRAPRIRHSPQSPNPRRAQSADGASSHFAPLHDFPLAGAAASASTANRFATRRTMPTASSGVLRRSAAAAPSSTAAEMRSPPREGRAGGAGSAGAGGADLDGRLTTSDCRRRRARAELRGGVRRRPSTGSPASGSRLAWRPLLASAPASSRRPSRTSGDRIGRSESGTTSSARFQLRRRRRLGPHARAAVAALAPFGRWPRGLLRIDVAGGLLHALAGTSAQRPMLALDLDCAARRPAQAGGLRLGGSCGRQPRCASFDQSVEHVSPSACAVPTAHSSRDEPAHVVPPLEGTNWLDRLHTHGFACRPNLYRPTPAVRRFQPPSARCAPLGRRRRARLRAPDRSARAQRAP